MKYIVPNIPGVDYIRVKETSSHIDEVVAYKERRLFDKRVSHGAALYYDLQRDGRFTTQKFMNPLWAILCPATTHLTRTQSREVFAGIPTHLPLIQRLDRFAEQREKAVDVFWDQLKQLGKIRPGQVLNFDESVIADLNS